MHVWLITQVIAFLFNNFYNYYLIELNAVSNCIYSYLYYYFI